MIDPETRVIVYGLACLVIGACGTLASRDPGWFIAGVLMNIWYKLPWPGAK